MNLPEFRYHPAPLDTESVVPSSAVCRACGQGRGYIYAPTPYAAENLEAAICPWCIADGSAADQFEAEFVDAAGVGGYGRWEPVPAEVVDEVSRRTPGFTAWQQEQWWTHCGDAAQFLGHAGRAELERRWPEAIAAVRQEAGLSGAEWVEYYSSLDRESGPTAYVFQCRHCRAFGAYSDTG